MKFKILVVDDEAMVGKSLKRILEDKEKEVLFASDVKTAWELIQSEDIDLILLDYKIREKNGLNFLMEMQEKSIQIPVIMVTAYGNIEIAVEAMKLGSYDFIQKKEEPSFIRYTVQRALDNLRLQKEVQQVRLAFQQKFSEIGIMPRSEEMKKVFSIANMFAPQNTTVLLSGETGTGKSMLAEYIHYQSARFNKPFLTVNCAAIPSELIESELFGYEKGAFTGANQKGKKGIIEQADGGTLFLDEISDLNFSLQTKLLHVLEKNEFLKVGAEEPTRVNVRFIAASNSDLQQLIEQKKFRKDLFYRLNVAALEIPPLNKRKDDIIPLTKYFIEMFNKTFDKHVKNITKEAEEYLINQSWPGNVRQLKNMIERIMLLKSNDYLGVDDLYILQNQNKSNLCSELKIELHKSSGKNMLHQAQKQIIEEALTMTNFNISKAAKFLGIPRTTLNHCINRFNINVLNDDDHNLFKVNS